MGLRQRQWAKRKTEELRAELGGKCIDCEATSDLTFDCIKPMGNGHHAQMDPSWRISFYLKQHRQGNLALRCRSCNGRKAGRKAVQIDLAITRNYLKSWRLIKLEYVR